MTHDFLLDGGVQISLVRQLGCQPDTKAKIAFCTPKPTASSNKLAAARTQEGRGDRSIRRAAVTSASKPKIPSSNVTWGTSGRPRSMSMPLPNGMSWSTKPDTRKVAKSAAGRGKYRRRGAIHEEQTHVEERRVPTPPEPNKRTCEQRADEEAVQQAQGTPRVAQSFDHELVEAGDASHAGAAQPSNQLVGRKAARIPHHSDPVVSLAVPESKAILAGVWPPDGLDTREGNRQHLPPNRLIVTDRRWCLRVSRKERGQPLPHEAFH